MANIFAKKMANLVRRALNGSAVRGRLQSSKVRKGQKEKGEGGGGSWNKAEFGHIKTGSKNTHLWGMCTFIHNLEAEQEG